MSSLYPTLFYMRKYKQNPVPNLKRFTVPHLLGKSKKEEKEAEIF
jgi:hypothetical protein